jgi:hypothetical protein
MKIYEDNNKIWQILVIVGIMFAVIASAAQGGMHPLFVSQSTNENSTSFQQRGGSTFTWDDDFFDASKIDPVFSSNFYLDTSAGLVSMANTFEAWEAYPEWQRIKPLIVTNDGMETLSNYVIDLMVSYDSDMQSDFADLRFADSQGYPLTYWIGDTDIGDTARVLVRLPELHALNTTTVYMFYGNPTAEDESDDDIFTWEEITDEDLRVSWTLQTEGAWDPDVAYGADAFLVCWEEGIGPGYLPDQSHRLNARQIHGRLYDENGDNPIPSPPSDLAISTESALYHGENPSVAFSDDTTKFFIAWEENPTLNRWAVSIKGTLVKTDGFVYTPFTIDDPESSGMQYYPCLTPCVAYDTQSDRFFVVWAKSDTNWDYDIYGKLFSSNGGSIGSAFPLIQGSSYQGQPWICSDNAGHFMVVYEEGPSATNGPFDVKAHLFDANGNPMGTTIDIAYGSSYTDHIFPSVSFNSDTNRYLVAWNTADVSDDDYNGKISGKVLDGTGGAIKDLTIQSGIAYKVPDVVPYLGSLFFVSYDDDYSNLDDIWGRLVTSNGIAFKSRQELSDPLDFDKGFANAATGSGNLFVTWEDDRLSAYVPPTEIRGSVWHSLQSTASSSVTYEFGDEKEQILNAVVMSTIIEPEDFVAWDAFFADYVVAEDTSLRFSIMDENGTVALKQNISSGESLSNLTEPRIRLCALFLRGTPTATSVLDWWSVNATIGTDILPPWTEMEMEPETPNGDNGWYVTPITIHLFAYDDDSPPENVSTYYRINEGEVLLYTPGSAIMLSTEKMNNTLEFWSVDVAGNEELPHNFVEDINIDMTAPFATIKKPPELIFAGEVSINGTLTEYSSGSGLDRMELRINNEVVFNETYPDNVSSVCFSWTFTAEYGETYSIYVGAYDKAGLKGEDRRDVLCSEKGLYQPGYLYLFEYPKIGPFPILETLDFSVVLDYDTLYVVLPEFPENTSSVEFAAEQQLLGNVFTCWDLNLTDWCSCDFELSPGLYKLTAKAYDENQVVLETYVLINNVLILLLS